MAALHAAVFTLSLKTSRRCITPPGLARVNVSSCPRVTEVARHTAAPDRQGGALTGLGVAALPVGVVRPVAAVVGHVEDQTRSAGFQLRDVVVALVVVDAVVGVLVREVAVLARARLRAVRSLCAGDEGWSQVTASFPTRLQ